MDKARKRYIDSLWMQTSLGKWVEASVHGTEATAKLVADDISKRYPFTLENVETDVCKILQAEMKYEGEFLTYLQAMDEEDPEMVEFMVARDIFGKLY